MIRRAAPSDLVHIIPLRIEYCAADTRELNETSIRSGLAGLLDRCQRLHSHRL